MACLDALMSLPAASDGSKNEQALALGRFHDPLPNLVAMTRLPMPLSIKMRGVRKTASIAFKKIDRRLNFLRDEVFHKAS